VVLACPVVSIHKERGEMIIYGGSVHLSKDSLKWQDKGVIYGLLAEKKTEGWGEPIENAYVYSLSQEHGKIKTNESEFLKYKVGQIVYIYPVLCLDLVVLILSSTLTLCKNIFFKISSHLNYFEK
jgi:D-serine deaminase-like pyridoxal phosphate-dependent protein